MTKQPVKFVARVVLIGIGVILIAGYVLYQARAIISGPQVSLTSPQSGSVVHSPLVSIEGSAKNISFISLNDRQIFVNSDGAFNEELLLAPGYNAWELEAKDKFGRTVSKKIELVLSKN